MSQLDGLKEQLAYLKLWLGIAILTGISVIGWLLTMVGFGGLIAYLAFDAARRAK